MKLSHWFFAVSPIVWRVCHFTEGHVNSHFTKHCAYCDWFIPQTKANASYGKIVNSQLFGRWSKQITGGGITLLKADTTMLKVRLNSSGWNSGSSVKFVRFGLGSAAPHEVQAHYTWLKHVTCLKPVCTSSLRVAILLWKKCSRITSNTELN
jgi:hypothetical protein